MLTVDDQSSIERSEESQELNTKTVASAGLATTQVSFIEKLMILADLLLAGDEPPISD